MLISALLFQNKLLAVRASTMGISPYQRHAPCGSFHTLLQSVFGLCQISKSGKAVLFPIYGSPNSHRGCDWSRGKGRAIELGLFPFIYFVIQKGCFERPISLFAHLDVVCRLCHAL